MASDRIVVENHKKETRVVQPSMIPKGFKFLKHYKEVKKKAESNKKEEKK